MSVYKQLQNLSDEDLVEICDTYTSASEYLRSIKMSENGRYTTLLNTRRRELNLEWKPVISNKVCPVCSKLFKPSRKEQVTCSKGCSNTHFRSGINHYAYDPESLNYRTLCFAHNDKECIICGEVNIVAVHHYDENHNNNSIDNLVPLCPTHHQYMHSRYKYLIEDKVKEWINDRRSAESN